MSLAVMRKTLRDTALLLVILTAGVLVLEALFVGVIREFSDEIQKLWVGNAMLQRFSRMIVGAEVGQGLSATGFMTIGYGHPLLFALVWTFALANGTRALAGEIDRGTADLLLTLPVSRKAVYTSISAVGVGCGIPLCVAMGVGSWLGEKVFPLGEPLEFSKLRMIPVNMMALYLCVGAGTLLISSACSRRGVALAWTLGWLLASFLINFLAQFWSAAERIEFLGILHYYRPLPIVRSGEWPVWDMGVLLGVAAALWVAGLAWFARRDVPAA